MYEKKTLPNGVRILTEHVPGVRSVSLGIWVGTGSRHESAGENGAAHFIEHMLFKGTRSRTAAQLAEEMDAVGGQINAFTTKECTCFYARVLDTHLARAADILCDMFFHSRFDDADVETERGVILEEIGMYEDNPEDLCAERLAGAVFKGSPLARPILGRKAPWTRWTGRGCGRTSAPTTGPTASWWPWRAALPTPTPRSWPGALPAWRRGPTPLRGPPPMCPGWW